MREARAFIFGNIVWIPKYTGNSTRIREPETKANSFLKNQISNKLYVKMCSIMKKKLSTYF